MKWILVIGTQKLNNNQIDAVNTWSKVEKGKVLRNVEIYNKKSDGSFTNAKGKVNNHIPVPFLPRIVTKEFRQLTGIDSHFVERMAEHLARTSPEYRNMDPIQAKVLARQNIERQKSYWDDSGMFGAQWSRIADLPPILGFDKAGNIISIKGNSVVDINNNIDNIDCMGVSNGDAICDDCNICNGFNEDIDSCGICFGNNENLDCNQVCFGLSIVDECGICDDNSDNDNITCSGWTD